MKEHAACLYRLCQIPGVQLDAAQELLAEIGPTAGAFASPERFASWVGVCPPDEARAGRQPGIGWCLLYRSSQSE
ncbi:MAG: transposase [Bryobacteraceae bacterium]